MKKVQITPLRQTVYEDLIAQYEQPLEEPCCLQVGQVFISHRGEMPTGFCETAWQTLAPFVQALAKGEGYFYGNWMKNPYSALLSCNDGFRPMSFLLTCI